MPEKEKNEHRYKDEKPGLDFAFLASIAIVLLVVGIIYNFIKLPNATQNEILHTTNH